MTNPSHNPQVNVNTHTYTYIYIQDIQTLSFTSAKCTRNSFIFKYPVVQTEKVRQLQDNYSKGQRTEV